MIFLRRWTLLIVVACSLAVQPVSSQEDLAPWPTAAWSTSTPEAQGIDSATLVEMLQFLQDEESNFHSVLLVRNGYLVLEVNRPPYQADENHSQMSATKTIISALTGIAIDQGLIAGVDQPVVDLFPELTFDNMDADKEAITVQDFLTMRGGLAWSGVNPQQILDNPIAEPAGTIFNYTQPQPRLMSYAIEDLSGMDTLDFARERLFDPLGIVVEDSDWGIVGTGTRDGGTGISLTSQEMAKVGYLYLNDGMWDGQQIVSADWVEQSTSSQVDGIDGIGFQSSPIPIDSYGYFWWVNAEAGYYMAWGIGSQLIVVFPEKNIVLVTTSNPSRPNRSLTDALEEYIIPLAVNDAPLAENTESAAELEALIAAFASEED
jgi:CubicO group peptidase (beta-lactamase class C family)